MSIEQSMKRAHKGFKRSITAFAIFAALFIAFILLFAGNQWKDSQEMSEHTRKLFGGATLPLFVQYSDALTVVEVNSSGKICDIMEAAATVLPIDPRKHVLTYQGQELCPNDCIADSGLSAESVVILAPNPFYLYLDDAIGDMPRCIDLRFRFDANKKEMEYFKTCIINEGMVDVKTGYLKKNETNFEWFEEFKNNVNEYITGQGFTKTFSGIQDGLNGSIEVRALYSLQQICLQIDGDNEPISVKLGNQNTFHLILGPGSKWRWKQFVAREAAFVGGDEMWYKLVNTSDSDADGIRTRQYCLNGTFEVEID